jgi:hypothetical protein
MCAAALVARKMAQPQKTRLHLLRRLVQQPRCRCCHLVHLQAQQNRKRQLRAAQHQLVQRPRYAHWRRRCLAQLYQLC